MSKVLALIADSLVMRPSRKPISVAGQHRRMIPFGSGAIEVWTRCIRCEDPADADLFVLKFSGNAGRAERSNQAPFDHWNDLRGQIWSVNPPGYGGSSGRASLATLAAAGEAVYDSLRTVAGNRPVLLMGNSLGTATALYLAARVPVAGLILRNPPPLRELIVGNYGWWNLWLGAAMIAGQVPNELCSITNAQSVTSPAVFVSSRQDRVVPRPFQQRVIRAFGGPRRVLKLRHADHATPMSPIEQIQFGRLLSWLRLQALGIQTEEFSLDGARESLS